MNEDVTYDGVPILDQRSMTGSQLRPTIDEVVGAWEAWGQRQGWLHRRGETELLRMPDAQVVYPYINEGRWVADCPVCNAGMAAWPEHDRVWCSDCGRVWKAGFPPAKLLAEAVDVLLPRPPANRHWTPGKESINDLKVENVTRGYRMRARR